MKDILALIGLLCVLCTAVIACIALAEWVDHRRWMTAAERERLRAEAREWGHKS